MNSKTIFKNILKQEFIKSLISVVNSKGRAIFQSKNTCGIAALVYLVAMNDIAQFVKFSIELYQYGEGEFNHYKITKDRRIDEWANSAKSKGDFNGVSLVMIGILRFNENTKLNFRLGTMDGMTWPLEIRKIGRSLLNQKSSMFFDLFLVFRLSKIADILKESGSIIILYRTSSWKKEGRFFKYSWHYIVVKNIIFLPKFKVQITYWDYGTEKVKNISILHYFFGVVKVFAFQRK